MRCGEDHEVGCGPCGRAVQAEPLVVNPGNTAWRFGHCTFKTPIIVLRMQQYFKNLIFTFYSVNGLLIIRKSKIESYIILVP